jgi:hypothetical protein
MATIKTSQQAEESGAPEVTGQTEAAAPNGAPDRPETSSEDVVDATNGKAGTTDGGPAAGRGRTAAEQATRRDSVVVSMPLVGRVRLPAKDELAFLGGVGVMAAVGVIEWPVAAAVAAGHALTTRHRNKVVQEFGRALERT